MMTDTPKKVLIVDDHSIVRHGLAMLIQQDAGLSVCGEAGTLAEATSAIESKEPDIIVLDLTLKDENGLDLLQQLRSNGNKIPVLILSMHDETTYGVKALKSGANGYVMKEQADDVIIDALQKVLSGDLYISPELSSLMLKQVVDGKTGEESGGVGQLSARELEVFEWLGRGMSTAKIAEKLSLSARTVEVHRSHIKKKLNVEDATQLVQRAVHWVESH